MELQRGNGDYRRLGGDTDGGYILWTIQRVYLGAEYKGPHAEALSPITRRETLIAAPLLIFAIIFGVYPRALFDYMSPA